MKQDSGARAGEKCRHSGRGGHSRSRSRDRHSRKERGKRKGSNSDSYSDSDYSYSYSYSDASYSSRDPSPVRKEKSPFRRRQTTELPVIDKSAKPIRERLPLPDLGMMRRMMTSIHNSNRIADSKEKSASQRKLEELERKLAARQ